MKNSKENIRILRRGLRRRCPQCGRGKLFIGWWQMEDSCPYCALKLASRESDTWAFMYLSTAFITGLFILSMLLVLPKSLWLGRFVVAAAALFLFVLSAPYRKGLAIAFDYLVELRINNHANLAFLTDEEAAQLPGLTAPRP
ncbi:MAG TPA: DUF983 domain-containing protein [bacterium]|nr:DUF983 domain-containing protein [bacterium]